MDIDVNVLFEIAYDTQTKTRIVCIKLMKPWLKKRSTKGGKSLITNSEFTDRPHKNLSIVIIELFLLTFWSFDVRGVHVLTTLAQHMLWMFLANHLARKKNTFSAQIDAKGSKKRCKYLINIHTKGSTKRFIFPANNIGPVSCVCAGIGFYIIWSLAGIISLWWFI